MTIQSIQRCCSLGSAAQDIPHYLGFIKFSPLIVSKLAGTLIMSPINCSWCMLLLGSIFVVTSEAQVRPTSTQIFPYIHDSVYSALSSSCFTFPSNCAPTIFTCASEICHVCTSLGITPSIEPCCCASSWPATLSCFSDYLAGNPITYTTPPGPPSSGISSFDSSAVACVSVESILNSCEAVTPDFIDLDFSSQSSCLCSANGTHAPTVYDGFLSTCLAWVSTANPAEYSLVGQNSGRDVVRTPCERFATDTSGFPTTQLPATPTTGTLPSKTASGTDMIVPRVSR
jgi:hypothetical protein